MKAFINGDLIDSTADTNIILEAVDTSLPFPEFPRVKLRNV